MRKGVSVVVACLALSVYAFPASAAGFGGFNFSPPKFHKSGPPGFNFGGGFPKFGSHGPKKNHGSQSAGYYRLVTPQSNVHTHHDDAYGPCGSFFMEVKSGNESICVFEGPQVDMTVNATYEYVPGEEEECEPPSYGFPSFGRQ